MKKIMAIIPTVALALGASSSMAFAHGNNQQVDPNVSVSNTSTANVTSNVTSTSKTGDNSITAPAQNKQRCFRRTSDTVSDPSAIYTGTATANSRAWTVANTNFNSITAPTNGDTTVTNTNNANVTNNISSNALTGKNSITGGGTISTGSANSSSSSITVLNSSINKIN